MDCAGERRIEGDALICWCPHITPARGQKGLGGETSREAYSAPGACGSWRLGRCERFCWSNAGLRWWAVCAVLSPIQYIRSLHTVGRDSEMSAAHNCKCLISAGDHFVRAALRWLQGAAYGVLPQEYVGRIAEVLMDVCGRGSVSCCCGPS